MIRPAMGSRVVWITGGEMGTASWTGIVLRYNDAGMAVVRVLGYAEPIKATLDPARLTVVRSAGVGAPVVEVRAR